MTAVEPGDAPEGQPTQASWPEPGVYQAPDGLVYITWNGKDGKPNQVIGSFRDTVPALPFLGDNPGALAFALAGLLLEIERRLDPLDYRPARAPESAPPPPPKQSCWALLVLSVVAISAMVLVVYASILHGRNEMPWWLSLPLAFLASTAVTWSLVNVGRLRGQRSVVGR